MASVTPPTDPTLEEIIIRFQNAIFGKDVRQAIVDGFRYMMNKYYSVETISQSSLAAAEAAQASANAAASASAEAQASAVEASASASHAATRADTASSAAEAAASSASTAVSEASSAKQTANSAFQLASNRSGFSYKQLAGAWVLENNATHVVLPLNTYIDELLMHLDECIVYEADVYRVASAIKDTGGTTVGVYLTSMHLDTTSATMVGASMTIVRNTPAVIRKFNFAVMPA